MPELGYRPVNKYLPPRRAMIPTAPAEKPGAAKVSGNALLQLLDKVLSR
jgi:hypothetical protein